MATTNPTTHSDKTESTIASSKVSRLLGFDMHSWEQMMLVSLAIAGVAALAVFMTTASVVILQRQENADAEAELGRAQRDIKNADARIAEAEAKTKKAELELGPVVI